MTSALPTPSDRGLVVYHVWNRCPYGTRIGLSLALVALGLGLQSWTLQFLPGLPWFILGSVLLLVRGHNNLVDTRAFDASAEWEPVPSDRLDRLVEMDRRLARWDLTPWELTNPLGAFVGLALLGGLVAAAAFTSGLARVLALDLLVLLVPHWVTGTRRVLRQPNLLIKARLLREMLDSEAALLEPYRPQLLMLLKGKTGVPEDIKLKLTPPNAPKDFLGVYGQIVLNRVNGTPYPYFYVVLVARPGFGVTQVAGGWPPEDTEVEPKTTPEAEILVVRQTTTRKSGYHTPPSVTVRLLRFGLNLADTAILARAS